MKIKIRIKLLKHQLEYVTSTHRHPALVGGYGSGKTFSNIMRCLHLLKKRKGKANIIYGAPTLGIIKKTFLRDFRATLNKLHIPFKENKSEHYIEILRGKFKGVVNYLSLDNPDYLIAYNATDVILDEFDVLRYKDQEEVWKNAIARARACEDASVSITTTPEGYKYTYELSKKGIIAQRTVATNLNKHLPAAYIESLLANYDEAHTQMYFCGEYINLNGLRAMYNYREELLLDPINIDSIPTQLSVGMDFNVNPFCLTVSYMAPAKYENGIETAPPYKITFDEFYIRNAGGCDGYGSFTDKAMMLLLQKYPNLWYQQNIDQNVPKLYNITICPDMTGIARKTQSNITDINILRKYGVAIQGTANPPVSSRIKVANIAMQKGLWKVTSNCVNLIRDMEMCVTDEHGELIKEDSDRTHILDAVTYDVFQTYRELIFKKPQGNRI